MTPDTLQDRQNQLHALLEVVDVIEVLREACFQPDPKVPSCLIWVGGWEQEKLVINAAPWLFDWRLYASCVGRRSWTDHEFMLPDRTVRGAVLQKLCEVWWGQFPVTAPPESIRDGMTYVEFRQTRRRLNPGTPELTVDGVILRAIVRRLVESAASLDPKTELHLSFDGHQMLLRTGLGEFHCPASGVWLGQVRVRLSEFVSAIPVRSTRHWVSLSYENGLLHIPGRNPMPALWSEVGVPEDAANQNPM